MQSELEYAIIVQSASFRGDWWVVFACTVDIDCDRGQMLRVSSLGVENTMKWKAALKDRGAFAHNPEYLMQALYDSIEGVGGDVSGMTRPAVGE
jgi:hypothetical protein